MKKVKRTISVAMGVVALAGCFMLGGCGDTEGEGLVVWSFGSDTQAMADMYNEARGKEIVKVQTYPLDVFQTRLDGVLRSGKNAPDVVALEISFVKKYVEGGKLMSVNELGLADRAEEECYGYTVDIGTAKNGTMYGISNQAAPGGFFYRRSMARELWGDDSPEYVQEKLSDWKSFLEVAAELKAHGDKRIVSNLNAAEKVFLCERENGWVKDNVLQIDPCWDTYLEQLRTLQTEKYCNETVEYSPGGGWFTDISGDKVFGYFLGAWGLNYHLKANAKLDDEHDSTNDWGVVQGPTAYYNGGTWFAGVASSKKKDQIKDLLEYWMFDQDFLKAWADRTGDFIGNKKTVAEIKDAVSDPFLGGQNHYELFARIAETIVAKNVTIYDDAVGKLFSASAVKYAMGTLPTIADTYKDFKTNVSYGYGDLDIGG